MQQNEIDSAIKILSEAVQQEGLCVYPKRMGPDCLDERTRNCTNCQNRFYAAVRKKLKDGG